MLVDNEHQCQLFYCSFPPPHLVSFAFSFEGRLLRRAAPTVCNDSGASGIRPQKHERPRVARPVAFGISSATGLSPPVASVCQSTSRMLRAGPAAPAESDPAAIPATSRESRCGVYGHVPAWSSTRALAARTVLCRAEHESLDRDEMVEHRLSRGGAVAARDRLDDSSMVLMRARGPARRVERLLATLGEQIHDRVHEPRDRPIVRGRADRRVKRRVLREARSPGGDLSRLVL